MNKSHYTLEKEEKFWSISLSKHGTSETTCEEGVWSCIFAEVSGDVFGRY